MFQKGDKVRYLTYHLILHWWEKRSSSSLKEGLIRVLSKQLVSAESDRTNAEASLLSTRGLKKHQSHPITASIPGYLMVKVKGGGHSTGSYRLGKSAKSGVELSARTFTFHPRYHDSWMCHQAHETGPSATGSP